MNQRRISDATLRVRDALYEGLLVRRGQVLTEEVARERANNLSTAVLEVLQQMAEEVPPPVRFAGKVARHLEDLTEQPNDRTEEDHA